MRRIAAVLLLVGAGVATILGQDPQPHPQPPFGSAVSAIVVDAVVRDAKGQPVTDLRKEDFQLLEDGVVQPIGDVSVAGVPPAARTNRGPLPGPAGPPEGPANRAAGGSTQAAPQFMALVFDRLSPDARPLAYKGALACLDTLRDRDFVGVFLTDLSLVTVQTYTSDRQRIQKAVHDVATRATSAYDRTATRDELQERGPRGDPLPGDAHPSVPIVASPESVGRPVDGRTSLDRLMAAVNARTSSSWEALARDQQGLATTNALLALTSGLGLLPGRKSVVFFAEGLSIPDAVLPHFRNVVINANRANVSIYTLDAAGLRVHSKDSETAREVFGMGMSGIEVMADGSNRSSLAMLERNEEVLRRDPRTGLSWLAGQTGGFLIQNTNDLAEGFRQIDGDRRFHYLLTYTPSNGNFDGRWRTIAVTVPNRRVTVRARSGYLAVRDAGAMPLLAFEAPALAALDRRPAPEDVPVRARALVFPGRPNPRVAVVAATDGGALRFDIDPAGTSYRADFSILARIKDGEGTVVRKASQPYRLAGRIEDRERAAAGEVLFFRQPDLDPGAYTLEVVVHDALAGRSGVLRAPFTIPDGRSDRWQVSSLMIVSRGERVADGERQPGNPLFAGNVLLYPNLGEPVSKARSAALTLFAVLAGPPGGAPGATLHVSRGGQPIAQLAIPLTPADRDGRIEYLVQLPLASLEPGAYTLRFEVADQGERAVREAGFELIAR